MSQLSLTFHKKDVLNDDVSSLLFTSENDVTFLPGQYIWVILQSLKFPDEKGERRAFSIASSNQNKKEIRLLVQNTESGFNKTLLSMMVDEKALALGPYGSAFVIDPANTTSVHLLAEGVAVAPFFSIVSSFTQKPSYPVTLSHCLATWKSEEIENQCKFVGIPYVSIAGEMEDKLFSNIDNFQDDLFFVSGSPSFVTKVYQHVSSKGTPRDNVFFEGSYPVFPGEVTEEDFKEKSGEKNILLQSIKHIKDHVVITDANGLILYANPAAERNTGYTFAEMRGNTPRLWGGVMPAEFYQTFWEQTKDPNGFEGEITNRRKNGETYPVRVRISPITGDNNTVIGFIGTEEDISIVKTQQDKLQVQYTHEEASKKAMLNVLEDLQVEKDKTEQEKSKLQTLIETLPVGVTVYNAPNGDASLSNQKAMDIVGQVYQEGQAIKPVPFLKEDGSPIPDDQSPIAVALKTGEKAEKSPLVVQRPDGSKIAIKAIAVPIKDKKGTMSQVITVSEDITKEREVDRMKTEFISLASHQLRTPLSAMKWFLEMLRNGDAGVLTPDQAEMVKNVDESNMRMIDLVNSLLNVSRIESGRIIIEPVPTNVTTLIDGVKKDIEAKLKEKQHLLTIDIAPDIPQVNLDPKLIRQVYLNLLTNSIKYSPNGTEITVKVTKDNVNLLSSVSDNGYGIPAKDKDRVFQKFYRGENIIKIETDGNGLGMYLVKAIVDSSGGKIWFESHTKDEGANVKPGTTFYFSIPLSGMVPKKGEVTLDS